ncbi:unnamed protein product [Phyllotreta striolata]|uniref:Ornithine decarboxylase n=1 Tax=Phyllotreta striolata TaxID=444603 RepID=A0A9N9TLC5_PHYSR|nr:unnamed protein product [Phyllotreta striolata]
MHSSNKTLVLQDNTNIYDVIEKIVENPNYDEPFFICDIDQLIWNVENWKRLMPRVEIFYAVKCNYNREVLETFAALDLGFDCATMDEISKIIALDVSPNKIVFSNPTKIIEHLEYAKQTGVRAMTFDNEEELYKIKKHYPEAELLLRIRCDDESAKYVLGKKFGVLPGSEALDLLRLAKQLELTIIGVHFHVGSGCSDYYAYYKALCAAKGVFDAAIELGFPVKLIDIGGGYPGETINPIDKIAETTNAGLLDNFPDLSVKIIAEPGKYCCNTPYKLVTQIHSKKIVIDENNKKIRMYYVDVNVYNSLFSVLFGEYYKFRPVCENKNAQLHPCIIWGSTSDVNDKITDKFDYLPDLNIGDWLIVEETGAYTVSISCEYNGLSMPKSCAVISKKNWSFLTTKAPKPIRKEKFTFSLNDFLKDRDQPAIFRKIYF